MDESSDLTALECIHLRELKELESLTVHRDLAAAAALHYCAKHGISPPDWVVKKCAAMLCKLLKQEKATGRGRGGNRVRRYKLDLWDVERWDSVEAVRRIRSKTEHDSDLRRQHGETAHNSRQMWHNERTLEWLRNGTFECASRYLAGRDARVGADAMKASYRRCLRRAGSGSFPDRYYLFDEEFLRGIGIPSLHERKPGTKTLHLYNLS